MVAMTSGGELSRIDTAILRYCDTRSPKEIADMFNGVITPERVAALKEQLLTSRKWITVAQEEELVLYRMRTTLAALEDQMSASDTVDLETAMVQLRFLKELGIRLDKRRAATQVDLETYDMNVAREMVKAYDIALAHMRGALIHEIDEDTWDRAAQEALEYAGREVAKKAIAE